MGHEFVSLEAKRAELSSLLASKYFARAPARSRMLHYLCEKHFKGEEQDITEYAIATEALGRKADFEPRSDSMVRVEAWRLRKRLQEFYATEGADHAIQIRLPDGGYIPQFLSKSGISTNGAALETRTIPAVTPVHSDDFWSLAKYAGWARAGVIAGVLGVLILAALFAFGLPGGLRVRGFQRTPGSLIAASTTGQGGWMTQDDLRILSGYQGERFVDAQGRVWFGDRWFTGGFATARPLRRIHGTRDDALYTTIRTGDFRYDIPLKPGVYEMHVHFSESLDEDLSPDSDGEDRRRLDMLVNGAVKLSRFDIVTNAGAANMATERVFKDVTPAADGKLHLEFKPVKTEALLNGIELLPGIKGRMRPVRILSGTGAYSGAAGVSWAGDEYFRGGVGTRRMVKIQTGEDPNLYAGERYGNFEYAIPVADGTYRVTLRFAEFAFGPADLGRRQFDVNCNGINLLKDFDILKEAGGERRAVQKTFHGLKPNGQGKLLLSFVPSKNYASVAAIEVVDESQ